MKVYNIFIYYKIHFKDLDMYKHFLKRVFDFIVALIGIIVAAIPMLFIAIAIKVESKGPLFLNNSELERMGKYIGCINSDLCALAQSSRKAGFIA